MFIAQGNTKENVFWKYLLGSFILFCASLVGQLPFIFGVYIKSYKEKIPYPNTYEATVGFLDSNLALFLMLVSFVFVFFQLYALVRFFHKQSFLQLITSRNLIDWHRVLFSFSIWAGITIISTVVVYILYPEDFIVQFNWIPFLLLFIIGLLLFPFQ